MSGTQPPPAKDFRQLVDAVSKALSADILIYTGQIDRIGHRHLEHACRRRPMRDTVLLVLTTFGGDPDGAYRIARCLGASYKKFVIYVPVICKSAGTLVCLGADELVIADRSELGPLDMQMRKRDEIEEFGSGLDTLKTLEFLEERALEAFKGYLLAIHDMGVSTAIASDMAQRLSVGLYGEIFSQLDPVRLGEVTRAMSVAMDYGKRLARRGKNDHDGALDRLVTKYPSHSFVLDRAEAMELFRRVRSPTVMEQELAAALEYKGWDDVPTVVWADDMDEYNSAPSALTPVTSASVTPSASAAASVPNEIGQATGQRASDGTTVAQQPAVQAESVQVPAQGPQETPSTSQGPVAIPLQSPQFPS